MDVKTIACGSKSGVGGVTGGFFGAGGCGAGSDVPTGAGGTTAEGVGADDGDCGVVAGDVATPGVIGGAGVVASVVVPGPAAATRTCSRVLSATASDAACAVAGCACSSEGDSVVDDAAWSSMPSNALCKEIDTLASRLLPRPGTRCMPGSASATHIAPAMVAPTSCTIATSAA